MTAEYLIRELQQYPTNSEVCVAFADTPGYKQIFSVAELSYDPSGKLHVAIVAADLATYRNSVSQ